MIITTFNSRSPFAVVQNCQFSKYFSWWQDAQKFSFSWNFDFTLWNAKIVKTVIKINILSFRCLHFVFVLLTVFVKFTIFEIVWYIIIKKKFIHSFCNKYYIDWENHSWERISQRNFVVYDTVFTFIALRYFF